MAYNPDQLRDEHGRFAASMIDRLHQALEAKGVPNARVEAVAHLQKHGVLHPGTERLTAKGLERTRMGPIERAKDRGARQLGRDRSEMGFKAGRAYVK
jgi:hypothetical protein